MMYASIFIFLLMLLLNILFRFASIFRLGVPLLYALFVAVLFPDFVHNHETATTLIFLALLALVAWSWVITIRKRRRMKRESRRL